MSPLLGKVPPPLGKVSTLLGIYPRVTCLALVVILVAKRLEFLGLDGPGVPRLILP